jgi:hypothetical protein
MTTPPSQPPSGGALARTGLIEYDHPASPQIGRWMRQVTIPNTELGACYKFTIVHFSVNRKPQGDVNTVPVTKTFSDDLGGIDALVSQVVQIAQEDANNLHQGIQLYAVFAHFKNDPNYRPRHFFRVAANEEYDPETSGGDPSEPPTEKGQVTQLMRFCESIMRTSVMNNSYMFDALRQENASQRELISRQSEQQVEMGALIQETLDNATARRISEREAENKQGMMAAVFEHLKLLFPVILNKLAGQKITPETDPSFQLLAALFEGMSSEQQQALATQFFTPTQAAVFGEFLETYEKRKRVLTSADSPGPKLQLPKLYDDLKTQLRAEQDSSDTKIARMEQHAKSFRDLFSKVPPIRGPK